ncbi:MAG TPA: hypothetical protein VKV04_03560, partial [Verrucomicrobiae bacterium]|nr:hypothetical protein [Verrucomicrobiae bacterium]
VASNNSSNPPTGNYTPQGSADTPWSQKFGNGTAQTITSSYGYNGWFFSDLVNNQNQGDGVAFAQLPNGMPASAGYFMKETTVRRPSETPLFFDENWADSWPLESDPPYNNIFTGRPYTDKAGEMGRIAIVRHGSGRAGGYNGTISRLPGAVNIGCFDGHVAMAKLPTLWFNYYWHAQWDPTRVRDLQASF